MQFSKNAGHLSHFAGHLMKMRDCPSECGTVDTYEVDIQCARFCYMNPLRSNLQVIGQLWNTHHLRKSRNRDSPHGKPEVIYHFPEMYGSRNYLRCVNAGALLTLSQSLVQDVPDCTASAVQLFTGVLCIDANNQSPRQRRSQRKQTSRLSPPQICHA